jgi:acetyltransferase-like isoleucine patch superfamily enzyme
LKMKKEIQSAWTRFWMRFAGLTPLGRIATRLATWGTPPYKGRAYLARLNKHGFVAPDASIFHANLQRGQHVFIGERTVIYQASEGGPVVLGDGVHLHRDSIVETGMGGSVVIGANTHIQPRCQFSGYKGSIRIGRGVQIAPYCAFYPYDHGIDPGDLISKQPIQSKGDILVDDDAWLGVGVLVLDGARIGKGAVIGAGSVVTSNIPDYSIAVGVPARVVKSRFDLAPGAPFESQRVAQVKD